MTDIVVVANELVTPASLDHHTLGMTIVDAARMIALVAHAGARNKHDGELYILHVHRVAIGARIRASHYSLDKEEVEAVAWLHDVVEDTVVTFDMAKEWLLAMGTDNETFADRIITSVNAITKRKGESNLAYYLRVKEDGVARVVKLADLHDNFRRNHMIADEATQQRMSKKYSLGMDVLG